MNATTADLLYVCWNCSLIVGDSENPPGEGLPRCPRCTWQKFTVVENPEHAAKGTAATEGGAQAPKTGSRDPLKAEPSTSVERQPSGDVALAVGGPGAVASSEPGPSFEGRVREWMRCRGLSGRRLDAVVRAVMQRRGRS